MGKFNEDEKGPRSHKPEEEYPDVDHIREGEVPGASSAVGGLVTTDTDVDAMLSATTPEQQESYEDPVQDKSSEWNNEAVAIEKKVKLNDDYFSHLNSEIRDSMESEEIEEYIDDSVENNQMIDYDQGAMVSTGSIGKRISVAPNDDDIIDESLEEEYDEIRESLDSLVSQNSPKRLMAFTQISEQEERVSQPEIYESENSLAQPTVSLVTDQWAEEGLVKKYENGDVEITDEGKTVMNVINEVEKDMYR